MEKLVVRMMAQRDIKYLIPNPDLYRPSGKEWRRWMQRHLLRLVRWLGASNEEVSVRIETVEVSIDDIVKTCFDQIHHIYERTGKRPREIIIGPNDAYTGKYSLSMNLPAGSSFMYGYDDLTRTMNLAGTKLTINPYQEGIVVVPGE